MDQVRMYMFISHYDNFHESCRKVDVFDSVREILSSANYNNKVFQEIMKVLEIPKHDHVIVHSFLLECDRKYGRNSKWIKFSETDKSYVLNYKHIGKGNMLY